MTLTAARAVRATYPHRALFLGAEALIAVNGLLGTVLLVSNSFAPPVSSLAPLGLHSWTLPGVWLFATVVVPSTLACVAAWRRSTITPPAVLVASGLLVLELLVQVPFLGFDPLQVVMGVPALVLAELARRARRAGWR